MKWELKRKTVEQEKNRNSREVSPVDGYVWVSMEEKIFGKDNVFSLEWKSEGVMDEDSGDSEEDEGEEDWFST